MGELVPLGPEDRAILALECRTVAGHTCKVVRLGPLAPSIDRLRTRVAERIALAPTLTRKLGGTAREPGWVQDARFDIAEHIVPQAVDRPLDRAGLLQLVARLFEQ